MLPILMLYTEVSLMLYIKRCQSLSILFIHSTCPRGGNRGGLGGYNPQIGHAIPLLKDSELFLELKK